MNLDQVEPLDRLVPWRVHLQVGEWHSTPVLACGAQVVDARPGGRVRVYPATLDHHLVTCRRCWRTRLYVLRWRTLP